MGSRFFFLSLSPLRSLSSLPLSSTYRIVCVFEGVVGEVRRGRVQRTFFYPKRLSEHTIALNVSPLLPAGEEAFSGVGEGGAAAALLLSTRHDPLRQIDI